MFIDRKKLNSRRNSVRNSLRRDLDAAREYNRATAMNVLHRAEHQPDKKTRTQEALINNVANLAHKVLGAFGVDVPIRVNLKSMESEGLVSAYTDFNALYVSIKPALDLKDLDQVAEFVYTIKGAVYHEGGHIKFTTPYATMLSEARDIATNGDHRNVRDRIGQVMMHGDPQMQRAWNIIEDQYMEMSMVYESPILGRYYTATTINVVIDRDNIGKSWPYVTGRVYLDYDLRKYIREEAKKLPSAYLIPVIDSVVAKYRCARNSYDRFLLVEQFKELLQEWGFLSAANETDHRGRTRSKPADQSKADGEPTDFGDADTIPSGPQEPKDNKDQQQEQQNGSGSNSKPDNGDEQEGNEGGQVKTNDREGNQDMEGAAPGPASPDNGTKPDNGSSGPQTKKPDINDMLDNLVKEAKKQTDADAQNFITSINEDIRSSMPRDRTGHTMAADHVAQSKVVEATIIGGIEHLLDQTSPSWRFRQENGVLDPTAYSMREPGETDYWSNLSDIGGQGYDLSVSVMLDTSYSMSYQTEKLSVMAYAIRSACDFLEIPCTVTTFNDSSYMLYRAEDKVTPTSIEADGGTAPFDGLNQLDNQRFDKKRHLVFILTDGEWSGVQTLAPWSQTGRYFIIIGLGMWNDHSLRKKNPNDQFVINTLDELPRHFTRALAGFLA